MLSVLSHPAHQTRHGTKSSEENSLPLFSVLIQWDKTLLVHVSSFSSLSLVSISTALRPLRTFILQGFPVSPTTLRKKQGRLELPQQARSASLLKDPRFTAWSQQKRRKPHGKSSWNLFHWDSSKQVFYNLKKSTKFAQVNILVQ